MAKSLKAVRVSDLKDQTGGTDRSILYCTCCGGEYSANKGDYFMHPATHVFKCCKKNLQLVTKHVVFTPVTI